ncbi:MAG: GAF domain-containing protein [Deltaproteobacteria bacterium]|nr:GAF domain-containing protein [Deltaproteobacteria bacterium]
MKKMEATVTPGIDFENFYHALKDIGTSIHSGVPVSSVLETVVKKSSEVLKAKGVLIRILNLKTHQLELGAAYGLSNQYLSKGPVLSEKVITDLCQQNKLILTRDIFNDPRVQYPKEALHEGIRMMLDAPIIFNNDVLGILRFFFDEPREFSEEELNFIILIAERGASVIQKAQLIEKQQSQYDQLALQTEKLSALGRMAAGIAHEINNPLAGILLFSTNMLKKVPQEGPFREGLEIIVRETIRCKKIIQELLEFSRESKPQMNLNNLNVLIEKVTHILENEFLLRHIHLEKRLMTEIPDLLLDENQIEQVLLNLLLNALQAIEEQGIITIRTEVATDRTGVKCEIQDTGIGIPPEDLSKIFEPFFSTKAKGTGLGLAVSYGIIHKHHGHIYVSSKPGEGTVFSLEFPVP